MGGGYRERHGVKEEFLVLARGAPKDGSDCGILIAKDGGKEEEGRVEVKRAMQGRS